jgi:predicted phage terminase large subunit-like protein
LISQNSATTSSRPTDFYLPPLHEIDLEISRRQCTKSFAEFIRQAWPSIIPDRLQWNWHIEAIAEHLEAVKRGEINRLLVNVPPGSSKSTIVGVMYPAWLWGPGGQPWHRYIGAAHEQGLAVRDNRLMRELIRSEWYQERWPVALMGDQNEKLYFENEHRGFRQACAVASMTGRRGHTIAWDDPLSPEKANSEAHRNEAIRILTETVPTRLNDPANSAIIVVMQRLHEADPSGYILSADLGYEHLLIPMEFEPERRVHTSIGWTDPRTEDGELLDPHRFPAHVIERDKKAMGSYAWAGQMQQRPAPREGGMFKRSWFGSVRALPSGTDFVRAWDLAASTGQNAAYSAGVKIGRYPDGRYVIAHCCRDRLSAGGVQKLIKSTAVADGERCRISLPQDPGQAGKAQAQQLVMMLAGYDARATPESGDKVTRAEPLSAQAEAGNVDILRTGDAARDAWIEPFLDELCLAKGTQIRTFYGDAPIESVRPGDLVLTRMGWRRVTEARCTNREAELWEMRTTMGTALRATRNHPIYLRGLGFTKIEHVRVGDVLLRSTEACPTISIPIAIKSIFLVRARASMSNFTKRFGKLRKAPFLKDTTSTTATKTRQITKSVIWSAFLPKSTFGAMRYGSLNELLAPMCVPYAAANIRQHNSEDRRLVQGSVPTSASKTRDISTFIRERALSAARRLSALMRGNGIAALVAQRNRIGGVSTPSQELASSADLYSRVSIFHSGFAADLAVSSMRMLPGKHEVYNLEVEDAHEYVANGILVHNCIFPGSEFKDQTDAASRAFNEIALRWEAPQAAFGTWSKSGR